MRALRGTKRVCLGCAVRFYDLSRNPILCPSCGANFELPVDAGVKVASPKNSFADKRRWRNAPPTVAEAPREDSDVASDVVADEDLVDEATPLSESDDDGVLEPESEDDDVSDLIETESDSTNERQ